MWSFGQRRVVYKGVIGVEIAYWPYTKSVNNNTTGNGMGGGEIAMTIGSEKGVKFSGIALRGDNGGWNKNLVKIIMSVLGCTITNIHSAAVIHNPKHLWTTICSYKKNYVNWVYQDVLPQI